MSENMTDAPLGPFQDIWDAWEEANSEITQKPISHFRRATEIQFDELEEHLASDDYDHAAREVIDVISVALNTMRKLGYNPEQIRDIARMRAERRMKGQALAILNKYREQYGI
jgi:hypothetical protein